MVGSTPSTHPGTGGYQGRLYVARNDGHRRPTIHDVARQAKVSKSLVSLVLQGSPKVAEASRQSILEAMTELGYQPNRLARALVARRSGIVGVIASDLHNPFFADVLDAVLTVMDESGKQVLLGTGRWNPEQEVQLLESLGGVPVDGILLLSPAISATALDRFRTRLPIVVTGRSDVSRSGIDTVIADNITGATLAVEHLTALGHRRIAHITGGSGPASPERERGFRRAMKAAGLGQEMVITRGDFTDDGGYRAMRRLLRRSPRPTAVFAANDYAALGALDAIEEDGLAVPRDMSLVGYDNSSIASSRHISLTSIDQPHTEMGRIAARLLNERIAGADDPARHHVLTPRLVSRRTTGSPPRRDGASRT
jgi:DNA-binding LacI/PurR family transcriptional regulator